MMEPERRAEILLQLGREMERTRIIKLLREGKLKDGTERILLGRQDLIEEILITGRKDDLARGLAIDMPRKDEKKK